jgi:hypothetical protein
MQGHLELTTGVFGKAKKKNLSKNIESLFCTTTFAQPEHIESY